MVLRVDFNCYLFALEFGTALPLRSQPNVDDSQQVHKLSDPCYDTDVSYVREWQEHKARQAKAKSTD
jgi:hypothetical protein